MDINEILSQAKKNQKEATTVNRYNTDVKPAKKLSRTVNPAAVKAFLEKKRQEEVKEAIDAKKKKEGLQKLRDESKTTKKANAMAKRTKDNLKVYRGEDVLGLYPEPKKRRRRGSPSAPPLSPEQERKYKAFIKHVVPKVKVSGVNDDDSDDGFNEPVLEQDERKMRKLEKRKAKARCSSNLEFTDLLQLAEKHKNKVENSSSSESERDSGEESDGNTDRYGRPLTAEEKYQRERRKRRELEERLKMASSTKLPTISKKPESRPKPLANFKIAKLNSGLSEEGKVAKVKALMEKFKKSAEEKEKAAPKSSDRSSLNPSKSMKKSHSTTSLSTLEKQNRRTEKGNGAEHKHSRVKGEGSRSHLQNSKPTKSSTFNSKVQSKHQQATLLQKAKLKPSRPSSDSEMRQTKIDSHLRPKKRGPDDNDPARHPVKSKPSTEKVTSNPYKHTVVKQGGPKRPATDTLADPWAKTQKEPIKKPKPSAPPGKCTLSVTSERVRTNCPDMAKEDPYIRAYKKTGKVLPKLTPEMVAHYKAAMIQKLRQEGKIPSSNGRQFPPQKRRYGVLGGDSDDEFDSDLEGFIVDEEEELEEEEQDVDVSSHIKAIFGYDKTKYGRESEWELSRMDASYKDIEREEKRSLRIAKEEDAREAKLEEERMKRMQKKRR